LCLVFIKDFGRKKKH